MPQERDPEHGQVTVKVRAIGICGSDLHWYLDGRIGEVPAYYPRVPGHEPAGEVVAVGKGVEHLKAGDRVVLEPTLTCGHCEYCLKGQHNNCVHGVFMGGCQTDGMLREFVTIPAGNATRFPKAFDFAKATLAEPLAVMMHMLELADIHVGDTVCVTGSGPIGMLAAATAKAAGASRVFIADKLAYRLKIAQQMGADVTIDTTSEKLVDAVLESTRGRGVDRVIECAGSAETVNAGILMCRPGGTVMLIGILSELNPKIDIHTAMNKELRLQTLKRSNHRAQEALDMMSSGRLPTALLTHLLPLEETPKAFDMMANYTDGVGKVVVEIK
jgi:2-desacetyl-2-hydroxyethyl bacteriochlorophyllide A dehydrogenase